MMNNDEIYDETYDEIMVTTASKCLACMTGYWDPEFEPSVEEIMEISMTYGDSLSSLSLVSSPSGGISLFSQAHGRWRSRPGQPAQAARSIYTYTEHAQLSMSTSLNYGGVQ